MFISFTIECYKGSKKQNSIPYNKVLKRLHRIEKRTGRRAVEKYLLEIFEKALKATDNIFCISEKGKTQYSPVYFESLTKEEIEEAERGQSSSMKSSSESTS